YIKYGDKGAISMSFLGIPFATNLLVGAAVHKALNDDSPDDNLLENVGQTLVHSLSGIMNTTGASGLLAGGSNLWSDANMMAKDAGSNFAQSVPVRTLSRAVGANIPSVLSDVNALLNHTPLNPTGEKALTRVEDENGKVDY